MVMASGRWLGVHLDLLTSLLIGTVAIAAVLVSQDAGRYTAHVCTQTVQCKNYASVPGGLPGSKFMDVPVRILFSGMADFVPCDCKLQSQFL